MTEWENKRTGEWASNIVDVKRCSANTSVASTSNGNEFNSFEWQISAANANQHQALGCSTLQTDISTKCTVGFAL